MFNDYGLLGERRERDGFSSRYPATWRWFAVILFATSPAAAQDVVPPTKCASCVEWNVPQKPFRVYGSTYYVGTHELSAILVASTRGLIVIDGDLAESAPRIAEHITELGFDPKSIKLILNSHAHFDHASGIAWLQRLSGARVAVSPWSAKVLRSGIAPPDDPQHDLNEPPIPKVDHVDIIKDEQVLRLGNVTLTAHFTPGHTPGGTSWSWTSCEGARCRHIVYADSLTAVSAPSYRYKDHPDLLHGFNKSFAALEALPCDILLSPHPSFAHTFEHLKARDSGGRPDAFTNPLSCHKYVADAQEGLHKRIALEEGEIRQDAITHQ